MEAIWENYYQTGIPEIDKQHKELLTRKIPRYEECLRRQKA